MLLDFQKYSLDEILKSLRLKSKKTKYLEEIISFLGKWNSDDDSFIIKSSGTTGPIKEIDFSRSSLIQSAKITIKAFNLNKNSILISALPFSFVAGKMMLVRALELKCRVLVLEPSSNPIIELNSKATFAAFTPYQLQHILKESSEKLELIDKIIIGGSKVNNTLGARLALIKSEFYETFGMSETLTHVAIRPINGADSSEYFTILDEFDYSINSDQCLEIKASHLGDEKLITTDIVRLVGARQFEWLGRIDNVINTGGVKVYPETIERKLSEKIKEPFIISKIKDDFFGEKVLIIIESEKQLEMDDLDLSALSKFEVPKVVRIVKELPRNNNGKIIRLNSNE